MAGPWRRGWRWLSEHTNLVLPVGLSLGIPVLLWLCLAFLPAWWVPGTSLEERKAQNDVRTTMLQGLGGLVLGVGVYFTSRQVKTAREGQITERYTRAVDQMGHSEVDVRIGGIFAAERIARDSLHDQATIGEVLTSFVRGRSPWPPRRPGQFVATAPPGEVTELHRRSADVQAAMTVLGRSGFSEALGLDLHEVDLRCADLMHANLKGTNLTGAHLEGANLTGANLQRAQLTDAHLEGTNLFQARLDRAQLNGAQLDGANLFHAILDQAQLNGAHLDGATLAHALVFDANLEGASLAGADLREAFLSGARLEGANLAGATLDGAILIGAHLEGAHLDGTDLSKAHLDRASLSAEVADPSDR